MHKLLMALFGLGALAAVQATPITYTDIYNPNDTLLSNSGTSIYVFTHSILDDGYVPGAYKILSADIYITMADDDDQPSENVRISLDDLVATHAMDVDYGTTHFTVNSNLLNDGMLVVKLDVLSGDFYFKQSELDVQAEAVPEPSTLALTGLGLLGLGFCFRRKTA